jgi:hypothetical protein
MKTLRFIPASAFIAAVLLASGCVGATLGQQLIDLQKARESGVLTEAEYQAQREKFLSQK